MTIALPRRAGDVTQHRAFGEVLEVTKLQPYDYFAKVVGQKQGRFGDAKQIRDDIDYFLTNGVLPRSKKGSF